MGWAVVGPILALAVVVALIVALRSRGPRLAEDPRGLRTFVSFGDREAGPLGDPSSSGGQWLDLLAPPLGARGFGTGAPMAEDYGWSASCDADGSRFRLYVGYVGDVGAKWLLAIEPGRRSDPVELAQLLVAVDAALRASPDVTDVRWHARERWSRGDRLGGHSSPLDI